MSTTGLFGPALKRAVTLRVPISTGVLLIAPRLHEFHAAHPDINLRIISSVWVERVTDAQVDIDLHLVRPDRAPHAFDWLRDETTSPICHRDHTDLYRTPANLLGAPLIHILGFADHWTRYFQHHGLNPADATHAYSVDTTVAAMELVSSGLGVAPVLTSIARQSVRSGRPVTLLPGPVDLGQAHVMLRSSEAGRPRPEVTAMRDWLKQLFAQTL